MKATSVVTTGRSSYDLRAEADYLQAVDAERRAQANLGDVVALKDAFTEMSRRFPQFRAVLADSGDKIEHGLLRSAHETVRSAKCDLDRAQAKWLDAAERLA